MTALRAWRERRAVVSVEFALIATALLTMTFGIIELGLVCWTYNALETAAETTARCVAIGAPACANPAQFAVDTAQTWLFPGVIAPADVTVATGDTCNNSTAGQYTKVTISSSRWSGTLPGPLNVPVLTVQACYPSGV